MATEREEVGWTDYSSSDAELQVVVALWLECSPLLATAIDFSF